MPLDPLTVVFAIVALVVVWKLRSVLGERTGLERPPRNPFSGPTSNPSDRVRPPPSQPNGETNVVRLPGAASVAAPADPARWAAFVEPGSSVASGLDAIAAADPTFSPGPFLDGAKTAYEAIVTAFAAGERKTLQNLLAKDVYDSFNHAVVDRENAKETLTTTFVSLDDAKLEAAAQESKTARVSVRFRSKQISATHGADGQLRDGSPDRVVDMNDIWTFARDVSSRDPNWKLVATESGH
jgi:predicted lipid-binding transport protein (Tim44 family)